MNKIEKNKLTIPIYLNTKIVFDMLATIEDGFADVKNVQTSKNKNQVNDIESTTSSNESIRNTSVVYIIPMQRMVFQ